MENLTVSVYRIPTDLPGGDATLTWGATTLVLVEAVAAGVTGLGFTYGSPATAPVVEHELADLVIGHDAFDVPAANDRMSRALRNAGRPGIAAGAVSAVDTALWDLKARLLGLPLLRLLGAARTEVAVYGSGGFTTYDDAQLVEQLRGWTDQGIDRVKIKIGESWVVRRPATCTAPRLSAVPWATPPNCTSTRTAATRASRPYVWQRPCPASASPGWRSPSPPTT